MVFTGMIFQFNSDEGTGLIMLSDGETKKFSTDDWVDGSSMPAVGLKISYESSDGRTKIKVPSVEDNNKILPKEKTSKEEDITSFASIEEFQSYFTDKSFDVIVNTDESIDDELTMGKYSDKGVLIVSISFKGSQPGFTKKTIHLSSVDDHIDYFKSTGYRLINDFDANGTRMSMLRKYIMDQHGEIRIQSSDNKVTLTKTINGKIVT